MSQEDRHHDETSPLLPEEHSRYLNSTQDDDEVETATINERFKVSAAWIQVRSHLRRYKALYILGLFLFVVDIPGLLQFGAELAMLQNAVCRDYYREHKQPLEPSWQGTIPEKHCHLPAIQSRLAKIKGIRDTLDQAVALSVLLPYGVLADTAGRRLVLILGIVGLVFHDVSAFITLYFYETFSTEMVYVSSFFILIGGGVTSILPILFAVVADVTPPGLRTQVFSYMMMLTQISEIYTPPMSSWAMRTFGAYGLYVISGSIAFSSIFILPFLPETLAKQHPSGTSTPLGASDVVHISTRFRDKMKRRLDEFKRHFREGILPLFQKKYLGACFVALSIAQLPRPLLLFYMQYVIARFGWKVENTPYVLAVSASAKIFMYMLVIPILLPFIIRLCGGSAQRGNLALAKGSIVFYCLGFLGMAISPTSALFLTTLAVANLGAGFDLALRTFITALVTADEVGLLYTLVAFAGTVGTLVCLPVFSGSLYWGIQKGGVFIGTLFFIAFLLYFASGAITWSLYLPATSTSDEIEGEEQGDD